MPIAFIVALSVQFVCQFFKFIVYSIRDKKISPAYLVTAGGMPSAHSAFVSSLFVYIGLSEGTSGPWFSISLVFGLIVAYDAFRLRGHVQKHAVVINALKKRLGEEEQENVSEMVGHSVGEVGVGLIIGTVHAWAMWTFVFSRLASL